MTTKEQIKSAIDQVPEEHLEALYDLVRHFLSAHEAHGEEGDPLDAYIGALDSEGTAWADQHDQYLGGTLSNDLSPDDSLTREDD